MNTLNSPVEYIIRAFTALLDIVSEYCTLATLPSLDEAQSHRMEEIFTQAEQDPMLNFLIDEADHIIGHELGLIDVSFIQSQQEKLQQSIDQTWTQLVLESSQKTRKSQNPEVNLKQAQAYLQQAGFYHGPIDGEYNTQTQSAFREMRQQLRQRWENEKGQTCSLAKNRCWEILQYVLMGQDVGQSLDPQVSDLLNLEVWRVCGFPDSSVV